MKFSLLRYSWTTWYEAKNALRSLKMNKVKFKEEYDEDKDSQKKHSWHFDSIHDN